MVTDVLAELRWRGLIAQVSEETSFRAALEAGPVTLYAGFDPSADSLHFGHLVPLLTLRRFQLAGHHPISLVGGGTGLIGDPSGKSAERVLNTAEVVAAWSEKVRAQVDRFIDLDGVGRLVDNYEWISQTLTLEFLRDVGKHFTVNYMLAKESVASRLGSDEAGISYTEFSYMLLQAFDYLRLYERYGCTLQIGGSDQWGNITAGIELVRRTHGAHVHALTLPLITNSAGAKFGKTEAGALWLDPARTSPYAFYQYFLNADDRDAVAWLRIFTFFDQAEIEALDKATQERPQAREAQRALARDLTALVHGPAELERVLAATEALFGSGDLRGLPAETLEQALEGAPALRLPAGTALPALPNLLAELGLVRSTSEARDRISQGGVYVNGSRVEDAAFQPASVDLLHGRYLVVRVGKRNYGLVAIGAPSGYVIDEPPV